MQLIHQSISGDSIVTKDEALTNRQLLGMLVYGEARGASSIFKFNVAVTVMARWYRVLWHPEKYEYYGQSIREIITKKYQYSCFLESDPNFIKIQDPFSYDSRKIVDSCFLLAKDVHDVFSFGKPNSEILRTMPTHYETMNKNPEWAKKLTYLYKIDNGEFYRED